MEQTASDSGSEKWMFNKAVSGRRQQMQCEQQAPTDIGQRRRIRRRHTPMPTRRKLAQNLRCIFKIDHLTSSNIAESSLLWCRSELQSSLAGACAPAFCVCIGHRPCSLRTSSRVNLTLARQTANRIRVHATLWMIYPLVRFGCRDANSNLYSFNWKLIVSELPTKKKNRKIGISYAPPLINRISFVALSTQVANESRIQRQSQSILIALDFRPICIPQSSFFYPYLCLLVFFSVFRVCCIRCEWRWVNKISF